MTVDTLLDVKGYFWWSDEVIPDGQFAPSDCVAGTLTINDSGRTNLQLYGMLPREGGRLAGFFDQNIYTKSIKGILAGDSHKVFLSDLHRNGANANTNGPSAEGFWALKCLITHGDVYADADATFNELYFDLQGFEDWLQLKNIHIESQDGNFEIRYRKPEPIEWDVEIGRVGIIYDARYPFGYRRSEADIKEQVRLRLQLETAINIDAVRETATRVEDLMILLTDSERGLPFPQLKLSNSDILCTLYYGRLPGSKEEVNFSDC